ncbi:MAG: hypothetical protein KGL39_34000 [Patescibacteria group bacterium]|nr:hypothetical protein [Patescibacteria group bacterium]
MFISELASRVHDILANAAQHVVTLAAAAEKSIHALEESDPLVATAINLALSQAQNHGIPLVALGTLGRAALSLAQVIASTTSAAGATAKPPGATPLPATPAPAAA